MGKVSERSVGKSFLFFLPTPIQTLGSLEFLISILK